MIEHKIVHLEGDKVSKFETDQEFVDFVVEIADGNGDTQIFCGDLNSAKEYINEYCSNLEYSSKVSLLDDFYGLKHPVIMDIFKAVIGEDHHNKLKTHEDKSLVEIAYEGWDKESGILDKLPHQDRININAPIYLNPNDRLYGLGFEVHIYGNGYVQFDNGNGIAMAFKNPLEVYKLMAKHFKNKNI